jgi:hypothetical protein
MSPKTLIIAAAALSASALTILPAAAAQDEGQARPLPLRAQILFNLVDVNSDGAIDQTEIAAFNRAVFAAIDSDRDGKLTAEEFTKVTAGPRGGRHGQMMGQMGPRGDHGPGFHRGPRGGQPGQQGQMQPQEFNQGPGQGFGPGGEGMPPMFGEGEMAPPDGDFRDFASLDTNGDGVVSAEEFAAGAPGLPVPR